LVFSICAAAAAGFTILDMLAMRTRTPAEYEELLRWMLLLGMFARVSIAWFIRLYFQAGRLWLLWLIVGLRPLMRVTSGLCQTAFFPLAISAFRLLCAVLGLVLLPVLPETLNATEDRSASLSRASDWLIKTWEMGDGLPENSATAMVQAPDGYLWFGTFNGLVRFDGVNFKIFNRRNTPDLPSEGIVNLYLDRKGRLWVSTLKGFVLGERGRWRQMRLHDEASQDFARTFSERTNGDILVTTFSGKILEFSDGHFTELPAPPGEKGKGYFGCVDEEDHWWAVQNQFIGRWEGAHWVALVSPPTLFREAVGCARARDGGIWLLLGNELSELHHGKQTTRITLVENPGSVWDVFEDSGGNVWIATMNRGLCRIAPDGIMSRWQTTNGGADRTRFAFEDRENNLWVGTSGNGLMRFTARRFHTVDQTTVFKNAIVRSVCADGAEGIWTSTYGDGLFRWNSAGITNVGLPGVLNMPLHLQSVLMDHARRLWIGAEHDGFWLNEGQKTRHFSGDQTGGRNIVAMFEDSRGRVWVSGGQAIAVYDGANFQRLGATEGLPPGPVVCFAEDSQGAIWVANGSKAFRHIDSGFMEVRGTTGPALEGIDCLKADSDGSMWLGTSDGHLFRWRQGKIDALSPAYGLPIGSVRSITADDHGFFWMTSDRSIMRVKRSELHAALDGASERLPCQVFTVSDGLPGAEFSNGYQPAAARDSKGQLWFATSKGLVMADPAELRLNEKPPPVYVEGISFYQPSPSAGKQRTLSASASEVEAQLPGPFSERVVLPAGSRRITIQYSALSYSAPEKVRFQVMLEGEDKGWVNVGMQRAAFYHELPPKEYHFRVRAANNDNVWNEAGTRLVFSVRPFYWQTVWFRLLLLAAVAVAVAGILWAIIRGKVRRLNERERAQEALRESEQRYREVVESQTDLVCRYQADTTLTFVNEAYCRYFGKSREQLIGSKFLELIPRASWPNVLNGIASLNKEDRIRTHEHEVILAGGDIGWQQWVNHPIVQPDGTTAEFQAIGRDITDRKRAEEAKQQLAHATRVTTMGALAGSLAHELNQPLTAILSNAQAGSRFLAGSAPNVTEIREVLQDIAQNTKRASEVIRQLRKLVKKDELQFEPVDLDQLIRDVARLLHSDTVIRKVRIALHSHAESRMLRGDAVQLQQVLLNLLLNAFDAMKDVEEDDRIVTVRTRQIYAGSVQIAVSDRGTGIEPQRLARLFEPFQTSKPDGLGLGLSICRSIVEGHGGRLWAENNPDRGATFCFTVPVDPRVMEHDDGQGFGIDSRHSRLHPPKAKADHKSNRHS